MRKDPPKGAFKSKPVSEHNSENRDRKKDEAQKRKTDAREAMVDETLDDSFPASDPPSFNKTTAGSL